LSIISSMDRDVLNRISTDLGISVGWSTVKDLVILIEAWNRLGEGGKSQIYVELLDSLKKIGYSQGVDLDSRQDREKIVEYLKNPERADKSLEELIEKTEVSDSKVLDADTLKNLLRDLDEHEASSKEGFERELERLTKNKLGEKYRNEIRRVLERQLEIYQERLEELKRERPGASEKILETIADKSALTQVIIETELPIEKAKEIVEETMIQPNLRGEVREPDRSRAISKSVLERQKVDLETRERIIELISQSSAEIIVENKISEVSKPIVEELVDGNPKLKGREERVSEIVEARVRSVLTGETVDIEETRVEFNDKGEKQVDSWTSELEKETGGEVVVMGSPVVLKTANESIEIFVKKSEKTVEEYRANKVEFETWKEVVEEAVVRSEDGRIVENIEEINKEALVAAKFVRKAYVNNNPEMGGGMVAAGREAQIQARIMVENGEDKTAVNQIRDPRLFKQVRLMWNSLTNKSQNIESQTKEAEKALGRIEFKENSRSFGVETKRFYQIFQKNSTIRGVWETGKRLIWRSGKSKETVDAAGIILRTPALNFARESLRILSKEGLNQGMMTIGRQLLEKRALGSISMKAVGVLGKTAGGKAVEKGLMAVAGKLLVKLGISSTGVGAVVMAGVMVVEKLWNSIKKIGKAFGTMMDRVLGKEGAKFVRDLLPTTGIKRWMDNNLPKWMSGIGNTLLDLAMLPFILITGLGFVTIAPLITAVVVFLFIGMFFYQMVFVSNPVSSLVPPNIGGGCVRMTDDPEFLGEINCKTDLPTMTVEGVDRENVIRLADQWRTGENHAAQCLDDVICRSKNVGVNPIFTIWVWLHESGASNYSIPDVEDFGIHGQPSAPPKDFSAQIDYFLTLKMETACPALNPWLSLATNFLTGGCDPDFPHPETGQTGRGYLENIREQIGWVAPNLTLEEIPLRITPETCSGGSSSTRIYEDENGVKWICYDEAANLADSGGFSGTWDPNTAVPEGCPAGRPTTGRFTQGPFAPGCSHYAMSVPAVDIGTAMNTPIRATHAGVVQTGYDGIYGYYIDLHGECEGKNFVTRYAHMPVGGYRARNRESVEAGEVIGVVDNTGSSTGSHLHYDIRGLDKNKFGQYLNLSPETAQKLWGCCGWGSNIKYCPP